MVKLAIVVLFMVSAGIAQITPPMLPTMAQASGDSIVDVFPLAIGNQWIYDYWFHTYTESFGTFDDTGTATIQIFNRSSSVDTTRWYMQEIHQLWSRHDSGTYSGPWTTTDTVELVEIKQDQHRLYINGDGNRIKSSVFSFFPNVDTIVHRYAAVDEFGLKKFTTRNYGSGAGVFTYMFKEGIGLDSVFFWDGCLCLDGYTGSHSLCAHSVTRVSDRQEPSGSYRLSQNYPNPLNPSTRFRYSLPKESHVRLKVFDLLGREIVTLVDERKLAGEYTATWDAGGFSSGLYFYRIDAGDFVQTRSMLLVK